MAKIQGNQKINVQPTAPTAPIEVNNIAPVGQQKVDNRTSGQKIADGIIDFREQVAKGGVTDTIGQTIGKGMDFAGARIGEMIQAGIDRPKEMEAGQKYLNQNKQEQTAGGFNYNFDREIGVNEQGQRNALQGTGHVAGFPIQPEILQEQQEQRKGKAWNSPYTQNPRENTEPQQEPSGQTVQPTQGTRVKGKTTTVQPTVSEQEQPQEPMLDFGFNNLAGLPEAQQKEQAAMQNIDLSQDTSGQLYGKVTADSNTAIRTQQDANSIYAMQNAAREKTFNELQSMNSQSVAAAVVGGQMAQDTQAMRDLMQYNSAKYEEIQTAIKQLKGQMTINSIANGEEYPTFTNNGAVNNEMSDFAASYSNSGLDTANILKDVSSSLASNQAAANASEQMYNLEADMETLKNRLKNLKNEAKSVFKGDVPAYIVGAYISNRTMEIQDQLSILEGRYNAAQAREQKEFEKIKWMMDYDLKSQELDIKRQSLELDDRSTRQGIALKRAAQNGTTNGVKTLTTLSQEEAQKVFQNFVSTYKEGSYGGQCGTFVRKYLTQLGITLPNLSDIKTKISLVDPNIQAPIEGDLVIMDSKKYPNYGHIAIVSAVDDDGTIHLLESNFNGDEEVHTTRTIKPGQKGVYGYYRPTQGTGSRNPALDSLNWHGINYDFSLYPEWNQLSDDEKITVQNLLTYQTDPANLPKTGANGESNKKIRAAAGVIGREHGYDERKFKQVDAVQKKWDKELGPAGVSSANSTAASILKAVSDSFNDFNKYDIRTINGWINDFKKEVGDPTVGAMYTDLRVAAGEIAKSLKGGASATEKEIDEIHALLDGRMGKAQAQETFGRFARNLVEKNASEALNYKRVVGYKPDTIYLPEVTDWLNSLGIPMSEYYNYQPNGGWGKVVNANQSYMDKAYNIFTY